MSDQSPFHFADLQGWRYLIGLLPELLAVDAVWPPDPKKSELAFVNIYTPSVFCYDKHKKNFDIQFSLKRHETV